MNDSKISVRYAKALFGLAKDKKLLDNVYSDLMLIQNSFENIPELKEVVYSPIIAPSRKIIIFKSTFEKNIHPLSINFLNLIFNKKREFFLKEIILDFISTYKQEKNIKTVVLTTAIEINASYRDKVKQIIKKQLCADIELIEKVDQNILGGIILKIDNQQYDSSVLAKINKLRREIATN